MALQHHRAGAFARAIAVYNQVIQSEVAICARSDGARGFDERFLMNRGDAYFAQKDLAEVQCAPRGRTVTLVTLT